MDNETFEKYLNQRLNKIINILSKKGKEYSPDADRLHNFNRAAVLRNTTPEEALLGMKVKHTVSIEDIINGIKNGYLPSLELLEEKIGDEINYWIILEIMIKGKINGSK